MKQTAVEFLQELNDNVNLTEDDFRKAIEMEIRQTQDACTEAYDLRKNIEISDEEIEKFVDEELGTIRTDFDFGVIQGMKFYREELKKK